MADNLLESHDQGDSAAFINGLSQGSARKESVPEDDQPTVGTPYYLAPEIWKSKQYGKESDIWALGVILYEMCCLKYPYPATELEELERKILNDKIEKYPNGVNSEFIDLFSKMLKKDTARRPCIEEIIYSDEF
jgi:NIMA (never in mitosis gene a)-related kinase